MWQRVAEYVARQVVGEAASEAAEHAYNWATDDDPPKSKPKGPNLEEPTTYQLFRLAVKNLRAEYGMPRLMELADKYGYQGFASLGRTFQADGNAQAGVAYTPKANDPWDSLDVAWATFESFAADIPPKVRSDIRRAIGWLKSGDPPQSTVRQAVRESLQTETYRLFYWLGLLGAAHVGHDMATVPARATRLHAIIVDEINEVTAWQGDDTTDVQQAATALEKRATSWTKSAAQFGRWMFENVDVSPWQIYLGAASDWLEVG